MKRQRRSIAHIIQNPRGFTLLEIIIALLLMVMAVVPMMDAFSPSIQAGGIAERQGVFSGYARGTLARTAALGYAALDVNRGNPADLAALFGWPGSPNPAEAAKENFTYQGVTYTPQVAIVDASGGTGGLLQISVTVQDVVLTSLVVRL